MRRCADAALGLREPLREEVAYLRLAAALLRPRFPEPARRLDQATAGWSLAEIDRADIASLVSAGLTDAAAIEQRAEEALGGFVGEIGRLRANLRDAVALARGAAPR